MSRFEEFWSCLIGGFVSFHLDFVVIGRSSCNFLACCHLIEQTQLSLAQDHLMTDGRFKGCLAVTTVQFFNIVQKGGGSNRCTSCRPFDIRLA